MPVRPSSSRCVWVSWWSRPRGCHRACGGGCGCAWGGRRPRWGRRRRAMPGARSRCATRRRGPPRLSPPERPPRPPRSPRSPPDAGPRRPAPLPVSPRSSSTSAPRPSRVCCARRQAALGALGDVEVGVEVRRGGVGLLRLGDAEVERPC